MQLVGMALIQTKPPFKIAEVSVQVEKTLDILLIVQETIVPAILTMLGVLMIMSTMIIMHTAFWKVPMPNIYV